MFLYIIRILLFLLILLVGDFLYHVWQWRRRSRGRCVTVLREVVTETKPPPPHS